MPTSPSKSYKGKAKPGVNTREQQPFVGSCFCFAFPGLFFFFVLVLLLVVAFQISLAVFKVEKTYETALFGKRGEKSARAQISC